MTASPVSRPRPFSRSGAPLRRAAAGVLGLSGLLALAACAPGQSPAESPTTSSNSTSQAASATATALPVGTREVDLRVGQTVAVELGNYPTGTPVSWRLEEQDSADVVGAEIAVLPAEGEDSEAPGAERPVVVQLTGVSPGTAEVTVARCAKLDEDGTCSSPETDDAHPEGRETITVTVAR